MDDEDEDSITGQFEDGHWVWDDKEGLVFISDFIREEPAAIAVPITVITGAIQFKDDIDLIEQMRFRKRFQRKLKTGQADIITVQDIKDLALFTAPTSLLSRTLINILHTPTTERFIRSLILYCHYYLQVADIMKLRMQELEDKIRTPNCEKLENIYRENLCDLRAVIAKEYFSIIIGANDTKKFHHMGVHKKEPSLSGKDALLFETLLRMSIQIVWIALGRRSFNILEVEINRLFKTEIYNSAEHTLHTGYLSKLSLPEQNVLLGNCVKRTNQKLDTRSPLANELFCPRPVDPRLLGLGVIKYTNLSPRLKYLYMAVAGPEEDLRKADVWVGIIGLPRSLFDTMLRLLPKVEPSNTSKSKSAAFSASKSGAFRKSNKSVGSTSSAKGIGKTTKPYYAYEDIVLPPSRDYRDYSQFTETPEKPRPCDEAQRVRWQDRLVHLQRLRRRQHDSKANARQQ